jgi:hypothetical protein
MVKDLRVARAGKNLRDSRVHPNRADASGRETVIA